MLFKKKYNDKLFSADDNMQDNPSNNGERAKITIKQLTK